MRKDVRNRFVGTLQKEKRNSVENTCTDLLPGEITGVKRG